MERPKDYMQNPYIGPQGETYHTVEALRAAEADYKRNFLTFIGPQGETCRTHEALDAARAEYNRRFNQSIEIPKSSLSYDKNKIEMFKSYGLGPIKISNELKKLKKKQKNKRLFPRKLNLE